MPAVKRFEDLECWKEARSLVGLIYRISRSPGFKRDDDLARQMRRSAVSSMANIAEGFHRNSNREFMRFLEYSRASVAETISHCYVAFDQDYITGTELRAIIDKADFIWKKVNALLSYLNKTSRTSKTN